MKREQFRRLIRSIFSTTDEEIGRAGSFDLLPRWMDLRAAGHAPLVRLSHVSHHLGRFPECNEAYETLLEAVLPKDSPAAS